MSCPVPLTADATKSPNSGDHVTHVKYGSKGLGLARVVHVETAAVALARLVRIRFAIVRTFVVTAVLFDVLKTMFP